MTTPTRRVKYLAKEINERCGTQILELLSVSATRGVIPRSEITSDEPRADDLSNYKICRPGDIVVNRMSAYQGALGSTSCEGIVSPDYLVLRPSSRVRSRWLHYLMKSSWFVSEMSSRLRGIGSIGTSNVRTPRVSAEEIGEIVVSVPTFEAQQAIADYLDTETARIDALIAKKQRMITLLYERQAELERTAVTGATTTSTNAVVPTGNQLIPILPATWRLVRARFLCSIETGSSDTDENSATGTYPFFVRSQTPQLSDRFIFDTEAVLTAGDGAGVGKVFHHFRGKFDAHQRVYVLHEFREVEARFFYYCFSAYFALAALDGSAKSTVDSVRRHMITEFPVPVPPREEQTRLVDFLDMTRARTERLVDLVTKELGLLRERRQALITAAVIGELDVPEVAA